MNFLAPLKIAPSKQDYPIADEKRALKDLSSFGLAKVQQVVGFHHRNVGFGFSGGKQTNWVKTSTCCRSASLSSARCMLPAKHCSDSLSFIAWGRHRIHKPMVNSPQASSASKRYKATKRWNKAMRDESYWIGAMICVHQTQQQQQQVLAVLPERIQPVDHGSKAGKKFFLSPFFFQYEFTAWIYAPDQSTRRQSAINRQKWSDPFKFLTKSKTSLERLLANLSTIKRERTTRRRARRFILSEDSLGEAVEHKRWWLRTSRCKSCKRNWFHFERLLYPSG